MDDVNGFSCICAAGFTGSTCQQASACTSQPCVYGQCYVSTTGSYICDCTEGFTGANCDQEVDAATCDRDFRCIDLHRGHICVPNTNTVSSERCANTEKDSNAWKYAFIALAVVSVASAGFGLLCVVRHFWKTSSPGNGKNETFPSNNDSESSHGEAVYANQGIESTELSEVRNSVDEERPREAPVDTDNSDNPLADYETINAATRVDPGQYEEQQGYTAIIR